MRLYHSTNQAGRDGIEREGFGVSHVRDSAGRSWFMGWRDPHVTTRRGDWWVVVELPDDVAAEHRYYPERDLRDRLQMFLVPWDVLNARREAFRYERWE